MRVRDLIALVLCPGLVGAVLLAQQGAVAPPASDSNHAKARYEGSINKAKQDYEKNALAARRQYIDDLDKCLKAAMKAEQLDEAIRIRDLKAMIESNRDTPSTKPANREGAITFGGSQYRIFLADVKWGEAREMCQRLGGDLASLDSTDKREFLGMQSGSVQLWVGATHDAKTRRWQWVNGNMIAADAWSPGRPQNNGPFAVLFGKTGLLGDGKDQIPDCKGFICEWKR